MSIFDSFKLASSEAALAPTPPHNIALDIASERGLHHWDGYCAELTDTILQRYPEGSILWVSLKNHGWRFHSVPVLNGLVHDAWYPEAVLPPAEYVEAVFKNHYTEWEIFE